MAGAPVESSGPSWWIVALVAVVLVAALAVIALLAGRRRADAAAATHVPAAGTKDGRARSDATATSATSATSAKSAGKTSTSPKKAAPQEKKAAPSKAAPQQKAARAETETPAAAPVTTAGTGRRTRADELTDELATLDLAWENGTITDERAYQRIRESLVAQLVAEVSDGA